MRDVDVAIIGAGFRAVDAHIPHLVNNPDVSIQAVCDGNADRLEQIARKFNIPRMYTEASDLLRNETLDVVDICVPSRNHASIALASLRNDCHVMIEKPMTMSVAECDDILQVAQDRERKVGVMHNMLFDEVMLKAKDHISDDTIGDVIDVNLVMVTPPSAFTSKRDPWVDDLPMGHADETLPHVVYIANEFLSDVRDVDVHGSNHDNTVLSGHDGINLYFNGSTTRFSASLSYSSNIRMAKMNIIGTEAALNMDLGQNSLTYYHLTDGSARTRGLQMMGEIGQEIKNLAKNAIRVLLTDDYTGTQRILSKFIHSIQTDTDPPITGQDGRRNVEMIERIRHLYRQKYNRNE